MSFELVPLETGKKTREEAIAEMKSIEAHMNPDLKKVLEGVRRWIIRNVEWGLRRTWKLGQRIKRVHDQEARYGANAVGRVARVLSCERSVLDKAMHFYRDFPPKKLEHLLKLRMKVSGEPVTYTHVVHLLSVVDEARRDRLLRECVENDWTAEELHYNIRVSHREETGQTRLAHAGGRPRKVPTTIVQLLTVFERTTGVLVRDDPLMYNDNSLTNFLHLVDNLPPDRVTPELLAKVDSCLSNIDRAVAILTDIKPQLVEARARAERKMKAQAAKEAVVDVEIVEARSSDNGEVGANGAANGEAGGRSRPKLIGHKQ